MHELVIASNNQGKIREIKSLAGSIRLYSLDEIGFHEEIEEPFSTFEQNALIKAETVHRFCGKNVMSDDSGLCVRALGGAPGVDSAFWGGLPRSDEKNNRRLLNELAGHPDRSAFYKAVICLIWNEQVFYFEGVCEGSIAFSPQGLNGFGYDPLFIPQGYDHTFGSLSSDVKSTISHRAQATSKMLEFLKKEESR